MTHRHAAALARSRPARVAGLPSGDSAERLIGGETAALFPVAVHTLGRAMLIGVGMAAAGVRQGLVAGALGGALGIEAFVLLWAWYEKRKR